PKLAGQVLAAAIPTTFGVWVDHFTFPFIGAVDLPSWVGVPITVVWIVAVMNMVNFLDGLDGLASGVCAIAGGTFAVLALSLDKSCVVAKRMKYGVPVYAADRSHLHHRFVNIGFSQRRAAVTMWAWCATLAAAALATRFVAFREGGHWYTWGTVAVAGIAAAALAFSVYIVYLLESVKLANPRVRRRVGKRDAAAPGRKERRSA